MHPVDVIRHSRAIRFQRAAARRAAEMRERLCPAIQGKIVLTQADLDEIKRLQSDSQACAAYARAYVELLKP